MIRSFMRWSRAGAPSRGAAWLFLGVIGMEAIYAFIIWLGQGGAEEVLWPRDVFWMLLAGLLGVRRVSDFHPYYHDAYGGWLRLTPWTSRLPLPLGPAHLVPQDALRLGLALAVWHDPMISRCYLPLVFLTFYLATLCLSLTATREKGAAWLLAFGLAEVVRQLYQPLPALMVASWLYLAGWIGLRRSLARFPWPNVSPFNAAQAGIPQQTEESLGFPLDQLLVRHGDLARRPIFRPLATSFLIGWWAYCVFSLATNPLRAALWMRTVLIIASALAIFYRTFCYCQDYRPPISLWGRLRAFRWIVPRYDHILVAPALIVLAALLVPRVLFSWQVPALAALAATISLVVFLALAMPPSFERWRLTGFFRIVPGSTNKVEFEKI